MSVWFWSFCRENYNELVRLIPLCENAAFHSFPSLITYHYNSPTPTESRGFFFPDYTSNVSGLFRFTILHAYGPPHWKSVIPMHILDVYSSPFSKFSIQPLKTREKPNHKNTAFPHLEIHISKLLKSPVTSKCHTLFITTEVDTSACSNKIHEII